MEFLIISLILYLFLLPIYPEFRYNYFIKNKINQSDNSNLEIVKENVEKQINQLPKNEFDISSDRLIINKIGINVPIVITENSDYGLSLGAWLDPESSRPDRGGNTVITGHRFKYLPPSNLTFYLLDKLEIGDVFSIFWKNEYYFYQIREVKIVEPNDLSILDNTNNSQVTLYTCNPIYSQRNRLVVIADLME